MLSNNKSFTLIELLVVIIIVSILVAVSIPIVTYNIEKSEWTEAVVTLGMMRIACRGYYTEFGEYHTQSYYLNGPYKSSNIPDALQLDVPDPDAEGRYIYVYTTNVNPTHGRRLGYAFKDEDGSGGYTSGEPLISIYSDGDLVSSNDAPEF